MIEFIKMAIPALRKTRRNMYNHMLISVISVIFQQIKKYIRG